LEWKNDGVIDDKSGDDVPYTNELIRHRLATRWWWWFNTSPSYKI